MTGKKRYILTSTRPMATKFDRVVGSNAGLLSTKSHNLLITWSHKVIQQIKKAVNSFSRDLWLSNSTEGWRMIRSHMSNSEVILSLWPCRYVRSRDKWTSLYIFSNFGSSEKNFSLKILYSLSSFIFASISSISQQIPVWTKLSN